MSYNTKIPLFRRWVLQNFPFIEQDFDALTDYQLISKVVEYLNKCIETVNASTEQIEVLTNAFNQLKDYVDNYFDNLDLQEEVNNKLEEMAESGELEDIIGIYLQTTAVWAFDTVADMVSSTNLSAGSFAKTMGYYSRGDNGGSFYRIENSNATEDGGSIIDLNNGLKARLIVGNTLNVAQFGIDSTHTTNIQNLVNFVNASTISKLEFNPIDYSIDEMLNIQKNDFVLDGNGCNITLGDAAGRKSIFKITGENTVIKNITITGNENAQNQWGITTYTDICDRRPFNIISNVVDVSNVNINNVWGAGFMFYGYTDVKISNCILDKIGGGFYKTDAQGNNDNFGDAFYFSGHDGNANILIENVYCNGYNDPTGRGSRGGVVLENLETYTLENTNVKINNSTFLNFNRFIHEERYSVNTSIEVTNSKVLQDCSYSTDHCNIILSNCNINYSAKTYNGSVGFRGFIGKFIDCSINLADSVNEGTLAQGSTTHEYIRCSINNIKSSHALVVNGVVHCYNTIFNFISTFNSYIVYGSTTSTFSECVFNTTKSDAIHNMAQSGSKVNLTNCVCNNVIPYYDGKNTTNKFYGNIAPSLPTMRDPAKLGMFTVTISGTITSEPNICGVLDATDTINLMKTCKSSWIENTSAPFMPTGTEFVLKKSSRFVIVWIGSDADAANFYNSNFDQGYYSICTTDTNKNITFGAVTTMGTPTSTSQLSFDETAHLITPANSNVKRVNYYVLPYEMLNSLRRVSL